MSLVDSQQIGARALGIPENEKLVDWFTVVSHVGVLA